MVLKAENLSIGYRAESPVFSAIDFSVMQGEVIALVGINGAGKSTLLRTLAGLQAPMAGALTIDGIEINQMKAAERAARISIVLTERINIDHITSKDFIALGRLPFSNWLGGVSEKDNEVIVQTMNVLQIAHLQNRTFNELSDGEKQRVSIARALAQETQLIILDEPTAFLDFKAKHTVLQLLQDIASQLHKTILFSTHDLEAALPHCTSAWVMTEDRKFIATSSNLYEIKKLFR